MQNPLYNINNSNRHKPSGTTPQLVREYTFLPTGYILAAYRGISITEQKQKQVVKVKNKDISQNCKIIPPKLCLTIANIHNKI